MPQPKRYVGWTVLLRVGTATSNTPTGAQAPTSPTRIFSVANWGSAVMHPGYPVRYFTGQDVIYSCPSHHQLRCGRTLIGLAA